MTSLSGQSGSVVLTGRRPGYKIQENTIKIKVIYALGQLAMIFIQEFTDFNLILLEMVPKIFLSSLASLKRISIFWSRVG